MAFERHNKLQAGQSQVVVLPPDAHPFGVAVSPKDGAQALVEFTISEVVDQAGTGAVWHPWGPGTTGVESFDPLPGSPQAVRITASGSGFVLFDVAGKCGVKQRAQFGTQMGSGLPAPIPPCAQPANYVQAVLDDAPVGYWRLNDPGPFPTTYLDVSGNGFDGTDEGVAGGHFYQLAGPFGISDCCHGWIHGASQAARIHIMYAGLDFIGAPDQEYTFEAWVKPVSTATGATVMSKTDFSPVNWNDLAITGDGQFTFQIFDGTTNPFVKSGAGFNDGNWHHVVAMRTLTTGVHGTNSLRIYMDGSFVASAVAGNALDTSTPDALHIGQRTETGGGGADQWNGEQAHVAVYDVALSDAQVANHHTIGTTNP